MNTEAHRHARAERLRSARLKAGYPTARSAAAAMRWNVNTYSSNENGNAPYSFLKAKTYAAAFGVRPEWLYDGVEASVSDAARKSKGVPNALVPVIGLVGADPEGRVLFSTGQLGQEFTPPPPGGTSKAVALKVVGHSMFGMADDGSLIYFEDQRRSPTADMLGQVVVVELDTGEVLIKRLLRGSRRGLYDLASLNGPLRQDCKVTWAAHVTAIIPPRQARRILREGREVP